jgi:hypothetical protein
MTLIQTITVGSGGASSVTLDNIPQTFDDLLVLTSSRSTFSAVGPDLYILPNADGSNSTSWRRLRGDGSSASSANASGITFPASAINAGASETTNTFGSGQFYFPNYRLSVAKSWSADSVSENNSSSALQMLSANRWNQTTAITSLYLSTTNNFVQHSTFSLYGITKGSGGATVS